MMKSWIETFDELHIPEPMSGCWLWDGCTSGAGYGRMSRLIDGKMVSKRAHRFSWEHHNGPIPEGFQVLHKCDVPECVNPDHLFLGSHQDNMTDRNNKLRLAVGEKIGISKLSENKVRYIRESKTAAKNIATELGVHTDTIYYVRSGRGWKHVK